jgi:hypothetical protein
VKPHCQGNTTAVALSRVLVLPRLVIASCLVLGSDRGLPHTDALMGTNIGAWHEDGGSRGRGVLLVSVRLGLRTTPGSWFRDDRFDVHVRPSQVFRVLRACSSADDVRSIVQHCHRLQRGVHACGGLDRLRRGGLLNWAQDLVPGPELDLLEQPLAWSISQFLIAAKSKTFHAGIVMRHLLVPSRDAECCQSRGAEGSLGTWHDGSLGSDHLPGLRRRGVASPQAPRAHDPCRVQLISEQAVLPRVRHAATEQGFALGGPGLVTKAHAEGLSPRSIKKYHVFLSSIFRRAVRDRILVFNPCDYTELPKVILCKSRTVTPEEFERLLRALPSQHRLLVETFIETECAGARSSRCGHDTSTSSDAWSVSRTPSSRRPRRTLQPVSASL